MAKERTTIKLDGSNVILRYWDGLAPRRPSDSAGHCRPQGEVVAKTNDISTLILRNLSEIEDAWRAGNDAGNGFSPEEDGAEPDAGVNDLAESTGWVLVQEHDAGQLAIYLEPGSDRVIAVGDANGAWCVDVTSVVS